MPYIVLEALAAGLPMVATNVGGIPEIFGAAADRLVPPGDPAALASAMERLIDHPDEAAAEAMLLRQSIADRFSITAMAATVDEVYALARGT